MKDKNQSERDLDSAIHALNESKVRVRKEVALAARKEKAVTAELKGKLDKAEEKEKNLLLRLSDLGEQLEDLHKQLDNLETQNSRYEENHGLSEVVRHQKRLEADLRRRDYDLKHLNEKLGLEIENRSALTKAVQLLKEKANLAPDFTFDDEEIQSALLREDNKLKSENAELSRQVDALEGNFSEYVHFISLLFPVVPKSVNHLFL
jgi:seryl-tRNA synthetase